MGLILFFLFLNQEFLFLIFIFFLNLEVIQQLSIQILYFYNP